MKFGVFFYFLSCQTNIRNFVVDEKANYAPPLRSLGGLSGRLCPPTRPNYTRMGRGSRLNGDWGHILWLPAHHLHGGQIFCFCTANSGHHAIVERAAMKCAPERRSGGDRAPDVGARVEWMDHGDLAARRAVATAASVSIFETFIQQRRSYGTTKLRRLPRIL